MKLRSIYFATALLLTLFCTAQEIDKTAQEQIRKLSFLTGKWKGTGWILGSDQQKHHFEQSENIQFKLDQTALMVEGVGTSEGKVMHNALAVVRFDKDKDNYVFTSFLSNGRGGTFKAELIGDAFHWYPNENMRYIIRINEKGQWHEAGEVNRNGIWMRFLEMILVKDH